MGRRHSAMAVGLVALLVTSACSPKPSPTASTSPVESGAPSGSPPASEAPPPSGAPTTDAELVLNEVRFNPTGGEAAFVEVSNITSGPIDLTGVTLRIGPSDLPIADAGSLPAGAQLLVQFDGLGSVDGATIHAGSAFSLPSDQGSVELLDPAGVELDRIAWGNAEWGAVATGPGGIVPAAFETGTSVGRPPGANTPRAPEDWMVYAAADASPGEANPEPAVSVLLPISGAILNGTTADLDWYPVPGAASYRVQVDSDETFASPDVDETATDPELSVDSLAPGAYLWRVQAVAAEGTAAPFSEPSNFELSTGATGAAGTSGSGVVFVALALADIPAKHLPVPVLAQRKDTAMLLLEENAETGAHPWDAAHADTSGRDKADNMNCSIATIAMISAFYGGNLSQDRIGYEALRRQGGNKPGPERDLMWGEGISGLEVSDLFRWALGGVTEGGLMSFDDMWKTIVSEIDAGRPIAGANSHHVFVVTGYQVRGGRRIVLMNDPWKARTYEADIDHSKIPASDFNLWLMPASPTVFHQEAGVTTDSDGDGMVDFDETERFKTNPTGKDGDSDKLPDKDDVRSGVFDPKYGYASTGSDFGRDYDSDGVPTERDDDSDEGGCLDGQEDLNQNGHRNDKETYNFDGDDDRCAGWRGTITETWGGLLGEWSGTLTATVVFEQDPRPQNAEWYLVTAGTATWKESGPDGTECSRDAGTTYSLVQPGEADLDDAQARAGQLRIWDGGEDGLLRYAGGGHYRAAEGQELRTLITCQHAPPSRTTTPAEQWLSMVSDLDPPPEGYEGESSFTFPKDAKSFSGTTVHIVAPGWQDQTWTWTFTQLGH